MIRQLTVLIVLDSDIAIEFAGSVKLMSSWMFQSRCPNNMLYISVKRGASCSFVGFYFFMTTNGRYEYPQKLLLQPKVQAQNSLFHLGIGLWRLDMKTVIITDSLTMAGRLKGHSIARRKQVMVYLAGKIAEKNEEETLYKIQIICRKLKATLCHILIIAQSIEELDSWLAAVPTMLAIPPPPCVLCMTKIAPVAKLSPMMMRINRAHKKVCPSSGYLFPFLLITETPILTNSAISSPWKI